MNRPGHADRRCRDGHGLHQLNLAVEPLLVMDMYEHSYHLDYGAAAAKYIEAFFQSVNWSEVNQRFERAGRAFAATS